LNQFVMFTVNGTFYPPLFFSFYPNLTKVIANFYSSMTKQFLTW